MNRRTRVIATLALVLAAPHLSACSSDDPDFRAGGMAAAEAYVDAIARGDYEQADEMTEPIVLETRTDSAETDVRSALPEADSLISQAWVSVVGGTYAEADPFTDVSIVVNVSYVLDGVSAGEQITLELDDYARPDDVESWRVSEPLLVSAWLNLDDAISMARVGSIDVPLGRESGDRVWGYPAAWRVEAAKTRREVEPVRIRLGAPHMEDWWIRWSDERGPEPDWR